VASKGEIGRGDGDAPRAGALGKAESAKPLASGCPSLVPVEPVQPAEVLELLADGRPRIQAALLVPTSATQPWLPTRMV
jgi:hypothetical protein